MRGGEMVIDALRAVLADPRLDGTTLQKNLDTGCLLVLRNGEVIGDIMLHLPEPGFVEYGVEEE